MHLTHPTFPPSCPNLLAIHGAESARGGASAQHCFGCEERTFERPSSCGSSIPLQVDYFTHSSRNDDYDNQFRAFFIHYGSEDSKTDVLQMRAGLGLSLAS